MVSSDFSLILCHTHARARARTHRASPRQINSLHLESPRLAPPRLTSPRPSQAGTFEEKSLTKWAKGRLEELLVGLSFEVPNMPDLECSVWTTGLSEVKGDVSVTRARGKTKHIFDLQIKIEWNMPVWEGLAKGTIHLPDVSGDTVDEGDIEFNVEVK